jgi:hypothetical protein
MALTLCLQEAKATADKATVTFGSTLELETVVRDGKGETTRQFNLVRKEKFTQTPVDANSLKIDCISSNLQRSGSDIPIEEKATPLAGHSFVATKTESGWVVKDSEGGAPPNEGSNLGAWNDISKLLPPSGELKAGDRWTVDAKDLILVLFPTAIGDASGKFECSCESAEAGKANILFAGELKGKGKEDFPAQIAFSVKTGRLTYDFGKKRATSLLLSGSFESSREMVDVVRKPGTGANIGNEEERRKVGEILVKSHKLEIEITIE